MDEAKRLPASWVALGFVVLWLVALNVIARYTWGYGPLTFALLLGMIGLVLLARKLGPRFSIPRGTDWVSAVAAIGIAYLLVMQSNAFVNPPTRSAASDIAINTWQAEFWAFDMHLNPYTNRSQTKHGVEGAPNVTTTADGVTRMFGVPYYYGYPYFPGMFLAYEPFRRLDPQTSSIRLGNGVYYLGLLAAIGWLSALLAPKGAKVTAGILAVAGFVCVMMLARELFIECVTDILIPLLALLGFAFIRKGWHAFAGILFGLALAAKLLPGALFVLIVGIWYLRKPERWKFIVPMLVAFLAVMLPYVMSDPAAFFSATILYYLTEHAPGDNTSFWFTLPDALKPVFTVVGYGLVLASIYIGLRKRDLGLLGVIATCFVSTAIFSAFNKMIHLNYLWAIMPLGAVVLVVYALGGTQAGDKPAAAEMALSS